MKTRDVIITTIVSSVRTEVEIYRYHPGLPEYIYPTTRRLREFAMNCKISKWKTIIMVTHRLSILKHFDHVIYLENGKVLSMGSFEEVRNTLPKFDEQARALGL